MKEEERETQVQKKLQEQKERIGDLEAILENLRTRLSGILRDEPEAENEGRIEEDVNFVPIARELDNNNIRLMKIAQFVKRIIELCEV